jgi:hypothetical protein
LRAGWSTFNVEQHRNAAAKTETDTAGILGAAKRIISQATGLRDRVIYLLRHGETAWNTAGRYQGHKDSPLTDRGREQAASFGRTLAKVAGNLFSPLRTYVSPLGRAQETADIVAQHVLVDRIDEPRLKEILNCNRRNRWSHQASFSMQ